MRVTVHIIISGRSSRIHLQDLQPDEAQNTFPLTCRHLFSCRRSLKISLQRLPPPLEFHTLNFNCALQQVNTDFQGSRDFKVGALVIQIVNQIV